jgi:flavin reductase (DIM6/NTAB) family NADH-FMN oxidoreductase RutF
MRKEITSGIYHLLHPKMTFFLTSISKEGKPNVMTCAWATPVSDEPPIVVVCVSKESYTAELIQQSKQYVINIPTRKLMRALWICGKSSGRDTNKFAKAKLLTASSARIKAPLIKDCIGHIECRLWKTVDAGECYAFFGKVVSAAVHEKYFTKGMWTTEAEIPLHLAGNTIVYAKKN